MNSCLIEKHRVGQRIDKIAPGALVHLVALTVFDSNVEKIMWANKKKMVFDRRNRNVLICKNKPLLKDMQFRDFSITHHLHKRPWHRAAEMSHHKPWIALASKQLLAFLQVSIPSHQCQSSSLFYLRWLTLVWQTSLSVSQTSVELAERFCLWPLRGWSGLDFCKVVNQ